MTSSRSSTASSASLRLIIASWIAIVIPNGTFETAIARDAFVRECKRRIAANSRVAQSSVEHETAKNAIHNE